MRRQSQPPSIGKLPIEGCTASDVKIHPRYRISTHRVGDRLIASLRIQAHLPDRQRLPNLHEPAHADHPRPSQRLAHEIDVETGGDGERHDADVAEDGDIEREVRHLHQYGAGDGATWTKVRGNDVP